MFMSLDKLHCQLDCYFPYNLDWKVNFFSQMLVSSTNKNAFRHALLEASLPSRILDDNIGNHQTSCFILSILAVDQ